MDVALRRFLNHVRPRARAAHRATYEDVAVALDSYLKRRSGSVARLGASDLRHFLGFWYLRHYHLWTGGSARRFCAALCVLVRWLAQDCAPGRSRALRREVTRVARQTSRAASVSALLEDCTPTATDDTRGTPHDGYWEVVIQGKSHVVLRSLGNRTALGPVHLPPAVVKGLLPGSVLNLQLVQDDSQWRVLDHGLCYPPAAIPALRSTSLVRA